MVQENHQEKFKFRLFQYAIPLYFLWVILDHPVGVECEIVARWRCRVACQHPPDPGVGVVDVGHDALHQLVEVRLHLLVAAFSAGRDGHQARVAVPPICVLQHGGSELEDVGEDGFTTQTNGQSV